MTAEESNARRLDRPSQWRSRLAIFVAGFLLFETVTGLSIYLLPFSIPNQMMTLLHTMAGLIFVLLYLWYQFKHWLLYRRYTMTHIKLTGYVAWIVLALCGISGLILTWQAAFGPQISPLWDNVHIITTFAIIAFMVPHILLIVIRDRRSRAIETAQPVIHATNRYVWGLTGVASLLSLTVVLSCLLYVPVTYQNVFPAEYSMPFGKDKPFAPSLATTSTGGAIDSRSLSDSKSCGQPGCHEDIYKEWEISAHRWASMDPAFQAIQNVMATQNGPESTRYCGGCHDPISLFSGTKNIFAENLTSLVGYNEGVSCIVCHAIKKTDIRGNANYVISQPERYIFENKPGPMARWTSNFLIRAYPRKHNETFNHHLFKSPEFCAACHKQFIDKEVNKVGWVQLQNQYDNWRKSHWNHPGDPKKTIECRECHMPLEKNQRETLVRNPRDYNRTSFDGFHRSHRYLGSNQFIPELLKLPGWEKQTVLTNQWLKGEIKIPEIEHKWRQGPAVQIKLMAPKTAVAGQPIKLAVSMGSNKVGHDFPTGPLDMIQSWLEVKATDESGKLLYATGRLDDRKFIEKGSFLFRAEPVDQYGNLIERHNLWEMVGVRYRRSLFPGYWDQAQFNFQCPASDFKKPGLRKHDYSLTVPAKVQGRVYVEVRLRYRKIGQFLMNFMFGEEKKLTAPITDLAVAKAVIEIKANPSRIATKE